MTTLLDIRDLTVTFSGRRRQKPVTAVSSLSLSLEKGESLSIIGESGSGKTTLMRAILGHVQPSEGSLRLFGTDVTLASDDEMTALRRRCALVSQDPYGSLPPTLTVLDAVLEPWLIVRGRDTSGSPSREDNASVSPSPALSSSAPSCSSATSPPACRTHPPGGR